MILVGTKVAVMPTNDVPACLVGYVGTVSKLIASNSSETRMFAGGTEYEVLLDEVPSMGGRRHCFKEHQLTIIQDNNSQSNTSSGIYTDDIAKSLKGFTKSVYEYETGLRLNNFFVLFNSQIKKVIFNNPKTIIIWADGTKTIVSCSEGDTYDEYAGFCAAIAKKIFGCTSNVKKIIDNNK